MRPEPSQRRRPNVGRAQGCEGGEGAGEDKETFGGRSWGFEVENEWVEEIEREDCFEVEKKYGGAPPIPGRVYEIWVRNIHVNVVTFVFLLNDIYY